MLFFEKNGKKHFNNKLLLCIKEHKNFAAISMLKYSQVQGLSDHQGATLMHFAAIYNNPVFIQYLLDHGCEVDATDSEGRTPLLYAVSKGRADATKVLLNANARIGQSCSEISLLRPMRRRKPSDLIIVESVLTKVTSGCVENEEIARKLVEYECPLPGVIFLKNAEITKLMIDRGCSVDYRLPQSNETALHVAVDLSDIANVKVLVEHGAVDVNARDTDNCTPLACFKMKDDDADEKLDILRLLLDRGASLNTAVQHGNAGEAFISRILSKGDVRTVRALLPYIDLSRVYENGVYPFHDIVKNEHDGIVDLLRGKSFNINARCGVGFTPLELAVKNKRVRMVKFLLEYGADPNNLNNDGMTVFYSIMTKLPVEPEKTQEIVELLLQYGANAQFLGPNGKSVLNINRKDMLVLIKTVLAHLAMIESFGESLSDIIRKEIEASNFYKKCFNSCKQQIKRMKTTRMRKSITLHSLLVEKQEKIAIYSLNETFASNYTRFQRNEKYHIDPYYRKTLRLRVDETLKLVQMKKGATFVVVCKMMSLPQSMVDVIGHEIVKYFQYEDLEKVFQLGVSCNIIVLK